MPPVHHVGTPERRSASRLRLATYKVKCFLWTNSPPDGPFESFGFAADISETGARFYTNIKLPKATPVSVAFEEENGPVYRGVVSWCHLYALRHGFASQQAADIRMGVQFLFTSAADQQRYLLYFRELRKRVTDQGSEFKF